MANLLYKGYKKGCYVGWASESVVAGDYCYGYGTNYASYYADLQPNTTYTIKRYDTSTRMRIGLSSQDLKILTATSGSMVSSPFTQGFKIDSNDETTFTTGANDIYLVVYYTNESEYNTRVMLNEGDTIQPYEAPTNVIPHIGMWTVSDGRLVHSDLPDRPTGNFIQEPYPPFWWYVDDEKLVNSGLVIPDNMGAFYNCSNLNDISIPENVEHIGEYSFAGTKLRSVTIARNCEYSSTSFPENCDVNFYD